MIGCIDLYGFVMFFAFNKYPKTVPKMIQTSPETSRYRPQQIPETLSQTSPEHAESAPKTPQNLPKIQFCL